MARASTCSYRTVVLVTLERGRIVSERGLEKMVIWKLLSVNGSCKRTVLESSSVGNTVLEVNNVEAIETEKTTNE